MALSVAEVLNRAADLIEPEGAWMQGDFCNTCHVQNATRFCIEGAVSKILGQADCMTAETWCDENLSPLVFGGMNAATWNDDPERTQAEVVAALRKAAALAAMPEGVDRGMVEREAWCPMESAPFDGTVVDLWWTAPDGIHGKRIADCKWDRNRSFNGGIGRVGQPDAWVHSHGGEVHLDRGHFSHWMPRPVPPAALSRKEPVR